MRGLIRLIFPPSLLLPTFSSLDPAPEPMTLIKPKSFLLLTAGACSKIIDKPNSPRIAQALEFRYKQDGDHILKKENALDYLKSFWSAIPEQVRRLSVVAVIAIGALIAARAFFVPRDFGEYGHYRGSALADAAGLDIKYAGHTVCADCHDDVVADKSDGYHKNLACEICHGPAAAHVDAGGEVELPAPRDRDYCTLCHEYLPSRPTGFPQIVSASHNPIKPCISCHNAHSPVPPETPEECGACHATIARTKALSVHVYVPCTRCHEAPEEHKTDPRRYLPTRPVDREFCGGCHDPRGPGDPDIRKVDMASHGEQYVCWQCHYPHQPEAR